MERMGSRRAGEQNGDGNVAGQPIAGQSTAGQSIAGKSIAGKSIAGQTSAGRTGAVRVAAATVAVVVAAALAGCSVTVQPKNAAASRPLSSSPTPSSVSSSAPSTSAASSSTSPSPTVTPSDVDHTVCTNVREALATLKSKLETDKGSVSKTSQDYRTAGTALRTQDLKTDNSDLKATLKTVGTDYQNVGHDIANHESADSDLGKVADASKPLSTLCGGGSSSSSSSSSGSSTSPSSSSTN